MSRSESKVPIDERKAIPIAALGHNGDRTAVHSKTVEDFAIEFFDSCKRGD